MSVAASLSRVLPDPKFDEGRSSSTSFASFGEGQQILLKASGAPPYGRRSGWIPKSSDDFGDGGAFPEINMAQYPLDMGRARGQTSNALSLQVDAQGDIKFDAIARRGHDDNRIIHTSMKDLIPLRQRADVGEVSLERPSEEDITATAERTRMALEKLGSAQIAASQPKNIRTGKRNEPTYIRYTPANQMGERGDVQHNQRIIKMVDKTEDPMEPAKFKHRKLPRGPPSPPPPILHSPPRKVTAKEQADWIIPPSISNWKNPKGYTIPLDKRMAASGQGLRDVTINDNFAKFSEALFAADRTAREEVSARARLQQKLAQKEKIAKEEHLRQLAQKARDEKLGIKPLRTNDDRSRSGSSHSDESSGEDSDAEAGAREREELRRERKAEMTRKMRMSNMGTEQRIRVMAREQNRDISEKIALGLAKPTASKDYDQRLYNQSSGLDHGLNEDSNVYDQPLFAAQQATQSIYRPRGSNMDDDPDETLERVTRGQRFEGLGGGKATAGFKGVDLQETREGPVQFEKDVGGDMFGIDAFLGDVKRKVEEERARNMGLNTKDEAPRQGEGKKRRWSDSD